MKMRSSWLIATASLYLILSGVTARAWADERTSENAPALKKLLERHPEADLNKDGILTLEEVRKSQDRVKQLRQRREATRNRGPAIVPTEADVAYGPHERNVLDFWKAESDEPTPLLIWIHGGGFRAGDKKSIPGALLKDCLDAGISCASINYRLTDSAPYPAQMLDSARAVQFLRTKADERNLDPKRFAAGGGSAGSGISQWLAFHDDLAKPDSEDPVSRQSTRLTCVLPIGMQSTYDPRVIKEIIPGKAYEHPALPALFDLPDDWRLETGTIDEKTDRLFKDASPINHLTANDPPIFVMNSAAAATDGNIHHPNFGEHLKAAADKLGIECHVTLDTDYESQDAAFAEMVKFLKKCFGMP